MSIVHCVRPSLYKMYVKNVCYIFQFYIFCLIRRLFMLKTIFLNMNFHIKNMETNRKLLQNKKKLFKNVHILVRKTFFVHFVVFLYKRRFLSFILSLPSILALFRYMSLFVILCFSVSLFLCFSVSLFESESPPNKF